MYKMGTEGSTRADSDGPGELVLGDSFVRQGVHPHGDLEIVQVVQEQAEVTELLESDALGVLKSRSTVNEAKL